MKRFFFHLLAIMLLAGCGRPPGLLPPEVFPAGDDFAESSCLTVFPQGDWQLVHQLEFSSTDRFSGRLIGVTVLTGGGLQCALVTVEGVTLFEATVQNGGKPEVLRAVPPFDRPAFAAGLVADLQLLFRPPSGAAHLGRLSDGRDICRYSREGGTIVEILPPVHGRWQVREYHDDGNRYVVVDGGADDQSGRSGIASSLELRASGAAEYGLDITLIEATALP